MPTIYSKNKITGEFERVGIGSINIPTKTSDLTNDSGFITGYTETDPTVPAWAKTASKPTYTASEIGLFPETWTFTLEDGSTVTKAVYASPVPITFTIGSTTYQAFSGMTWAEWCEGEYNTDGYRIGSNGTVLNSISQVVATNDMEAVMATHTVTEGCSYIIADGGAA